MTIFEYMAMVVAIVLGLSMTNLLNKFATTMRTGNWRQLWFRSLWCLILLVCTIGYLWAFWRIYGDYTEISIWSFIAGPFFTVVCFFLISVLLPIPLPAEVHLEAVEHFMSSRKPFFVALTVLWLHLSLTTIALGFEQLPLEIFFGWMMVPVSISGCWLESVRAHQILAALWSLCFLSQELLQLAITFS